MACLQIKHPNVGINMPVTWSVGDRTSTSRCRSQVSILILRRRRVTSNLTRHVTCAGCSFGPGDAKRSGAQMVRRSRGPRCLFNRPCDLDLGKTFSGWPVWILWSMGEAFSVYRVALGVLSAMISLGVPTVLHDLHSTSEMPPFVGK